MLRKYHRPGVTKRVDTPEMITIKRLFGISIELTGERIRGDRRLRRPRRQGWHRTGDSRGPLAFPLTAFVFLASFIPIIGALDGIVAVLVADVKVGLVKAIIVFGCGHRSATASSARAAPRPASRAVHVHPLAVALSITAGVIIAGISGALLAVPIAPCANAAGKYLVGKEHSSADSKDNVQMALEQEAETSRS